MKPTNEYDKKELKAFLDYVRGALTASETSDDFIHLMAREETAPFFQEGK